LADGRIRVIEAKQTVGWQRTVINAARFEAGLERGVNIDVWCGLILDRNFRREIGVRKVDWSLEKAAWDECRTCREKCVDKGN
jgi:hypothetical protein